MKKKLLTVLLCAAMLTTSTVTAFAADTSPNTNTGGDTSISVKGTYQAGTAGADVISVGVSWGQMEFTYQALGKKWDPESHTTTTLTSGTWSANGNDITITNHSNVAVTASFAFSTEKGVGGKFYDSATSGNEITSLDLVRAEEGSAKDSVQDTVYFVIETGSISASYDQLGKITVTIAKKAS